MFYIAFDPIYVHKLPEGHRFPMLKYELIPEQLRHEGVAQSAQFFSPKPSPAISDMMLVHEPTYVKRLLELKLSDKEIRRCGFPLSRELIHRETCIAQGTIEGCLMALDTGISFNVAGGTHHAGSNWAEGFCLLNDQAIAAGYLLKHTSVKQVLIIDLDVHQGNGTAEIFANEKRVFTFSMHAEKNFPFKKEQSDLDVPLVNGISDGTYIKLLKHHLTTLINQVKPDFVFYQAGVDVLASDKLGHLKLSKLGCKQRDEIVLVTCRQHNIPLQVSMGGGYSPQIRDIVDAHCNTFKCAREIF